jgi:glycine/D-amino acid oxidase-like deaminating enzyme
VKAARRRLLAGAAGATLLAACAPFSTRRPSFTLPRVNVSADRVTRVLVGLRPYRPEGFVVRAEALGGKRLVHNYGHGGGGITLSWGTSQQAVELAAPSPRDRCAVLGCGVIGLTTALLLQRRGAAVTIYAKALPPETTSNIAGGHWSPVSVYDVSAATPGYVEQHNRALRISYRAFQALAGPRHGVSWHRNFVIHDHETPIGPMQLSNRDVIPELSQLAPGEHPFGNAYVTYYMAMMIEPNRYLRALMDEFLLAGGKIEVRDFASREDVASLPQSLVFNCTGLGARELFGDDALIPVRGQLVVLLPQPEVDYNAFSAGTYMFPRADGIVLGGTFERGNWSLEADEGTTARILEGNAALMARLG